MKEEPTDRAAMLWYGRSTIPYHTTYYCDDTRGCDLRPERVDRQTHICKYALLLLLLTVRW